MSKPFSFNVALPYIGPIINAEGFIACVEPEMWSHFVIDDHSKNGDFHHYALEGKGARVKYNPGGSIAECYNRAFAEGQDFTIQLSCSMRFPEGLAKVVQEVADQIGEWGFYTHSNGGHLTATTRACVQKVGTYDENFAPAYMEDTDYGRRMGIVGAFRKRGVVTAICVGHAVAAALALWNTDGKHLADYYAKKWGGTPGYEGSIYPFQDTSKDVRYWKK